MKIEEAIEILKKDLKDSEEFHKIVNLDKFELGKNYLLRNEAIETVLQAVENSIPKEVIEKEIEELKNMNVEGKLFTTAVKFATKILQEILGGKQL